ncbi:MAG: hypothetical protein Q9184_001710 [Pyrenodesmia sp. 2 TL-2023]
MPFISSTASLRAELVAVSTPDDIEITWAREYLGPFGVALYQSYEEKLDYDGLQAVVVASVTSVHADQAVEMNFNEPPPAYHKVEMSDKGIELESLAHQQPRHRVYSPERYDESLPATPHRSARSRVRQSAGNRGWSYVFSLLLLLCLVGPLVLWQVLLSGKEDLLCNNKWFASYVGPLLTYVNGLAIGLAVSKVILDLLPDNTLPTKLGCTIFASLYSYWYGSILRMVFQTMCDCLQH